jgi:hypothetical protein
MNVTSSDTAGEMWIPSPELHAYWARLRLQITPFNSIVALGGSEYRAFCELEKQWLSVQYK